MTRRWRVRAAERPACRRANPPSSASIQSKDRMIFLCPKVIQADAAFLKSFWSWRENVINWNGNNQYVVHLLREECECVFGGTA